MGKSGGGGGGYSTAGLERATEQATKLQKEIYDLTREDVEPWYQAGKAGIGKLADLLGISGGEVQNRDQIRSELLPEYTTKTAASGGNIVVTPEGKVVDLDKVNKNNLTAFLGSDPTMNEAAIGELLRIKESGGDIKDTADLYGYTMMGGYQPASETVDYEGLNAAIESRLGSQGTPEGYGSLLEPFTQEKFEADPGYQFRKEEAQKALERQMAAQGVTLGGAGLGNINPQVARAIIEQNQGLANQAYNEAFDRYNIGQSNIYNRLMGIAGMGQKSTGQMAGAGQIHATNVGQLQTGLASAQANMAAAQASQPSMFSQLLGAGAQLGSAYLFSDRDMKENIELVGKQNGYNIYEFDYKDGSGRFRGVMADEVMEVEPDAVTKSPSGHLMVDYGKIGLMMEKV